MIYFTKPNNFKPTCEVVSCYIDCGGRILLLRRQPHKPEGGTWGVPAGKVNSGENYLQAICREVNEETGVHIEQSQLVDKGVCYVRYPTYDFIIHIFSSAVAHQLQVILNPHEHSEYQWATPTEALSLPLIQDEDACIKHVYTL